MLPLTLSTKRRCSQSLTGTKLRAMALACLVGNLSPAHAFIVGDYYEESASVSCTTPTFCTAVFPALSGSQSVVVTHVACGVQTSPEAEFGSVALAVIEPQESFKRYKELALKENLQLSSSGSRYYAISTDAPYMVSPPQRPIVVLELREGPVASLGGQCQLVGEVYEG